MVKLRKSGNLPPPVSVYSSRERELKMPSGFHPARFYATVDSIFPCFVIIASLLTGVFHVSAFAGEADSLRWHFEGQRRMRDDGVEAHFSLYGADALNIDELEFFYTTDPGRRRSQNVKPEIPKTVYHKKVSADTRSIVIYSGRYVQLELWAVAKTGGCTYVTQTALNMYGQSGLDKSDFEKLDDLPSFPGLDIRRQGFYSAMTGEPISFSIRSGHADAVRVYLDGEMIDELRPEDGVYNYILPGGRKLSTRALMNYHELLFVADAFEAEDADADVRFTCCLPMYRSMRDNQDYSGGLAALFSAVALTLIAVVLKGRRFAWR